MRIFLCKFALVFAAIALQSCSFTRAVKDDFDVYVPTGSTWQALRDSLASHGVAKPQRVGDDDAAPRAGYYRLRNGLSYRNLSRVFEHGLQTPVRVTFNNQPTLAHLAGRVARQLESDSTTFAAALLSDTLASRYGFDNQTFIAMFLPDTYEFYWTAPPTEFVEKMNRQWERFWTSERDAQAKEAGLTRIEAATLASIVYEETKAEDEMARVAGVYINRLRAGMPLQADPTVKFAFMQTQPAGTEPPRRILRAHLQVDSPYNTYEHAGLPPGPIAMPSIAALNAVLEYEKHDYLYFAARPDLAGRHNFAATLDEHNRNAAEYRRAIQ